MKPAAARPASLWLAVLVAATVAWRLVLAQRSPVPSEDGVSYLWMAQQFAAGSWSQALDEVFPPGLPLACAPWLWLGFDAWTVAVVLSALAAGLTLVPLVRLADLVRPGAGLATAVLWASGSLLARTAAEVYSEPLFLLVMACGCLCGLREQWWRLGLCSGAAFWIRPEGVLLALAFVLVRRRAALAACAPVAAAVLGLGLLRAAFGLGFDPLPIHAFHELRLDLPERGQFFANLLHLPAAWLEAFGPLGVLPLFARHSRPTQLAANPCWRPLVWQIVLQVAVVCTFVVRKRFLLSAAVPVFALAGAALCALPARGRNLALAALAGFGLVGAWQGTIEPDRIAERRVGEFLASRLQAGDELTGDLTRVLWFAGRRPLPPRHFSTSELLAMTEPPAVRFVVLSARSRREQFDDLSAGLAVHFERLALPAGLEELAGARGVAVFARR